MHNKFFKDLKAALEDVVAYKKGKLDLQEWCFFEGAIMNIVELSKEELFAIDKDFLEKGDLDAGLTQLFVKILDCHANAMDKNKLLNKLNIALDRIVRHERAIR